MFGNAFFMSAAEKSFCLNMAHINSCLSLFIVNIPDNETIVKKIEKTHNQLQRIPINFVFSQQVQSALK